MSGPRYSVIPAGALDDVIAGLMKDSDLRILNAIGTYTNKKGWTFPTRQEVFAKRCGFGRQRVTEGLATLEWLGWVEARDGRADQPKSYRVKLDIGDEREPGVAPARSLKDFKAWRRTGEWPPLSSNGDNALSSNGDNPIVVAETTRLVVAGTTTESTLSTESNPRAEIPWTAERWREVRGRIRRLLKGKWGPSPLPLLRCEGGRIIAPSRPIAVAAAKAHASLLGGMGVTVIGVENSSEEVKL